ncbi:MAG: glycosyltransferase family 2 protein, partial [Bacteroidota bacterium]
NLLEENSIVLGFSPYRSSKGLLNLFIRFETVLAATQYLSFAIAGLPYMGVGRNLVYKKQLFEQAGGFKKHRHIASGDDDLFINAVANKQNTGIAITPSAFTFSIPKSSWRDFHYQKSRHLTTGSKYRLKHQILLGVFSLSHFSHYVLGFLLLTFPIYVDAVALIYLIRLIIVMSIYFFILKKLNQKDIWPYVPFLDALFVLYYAVFATRLFFGNLNKWS